MQFPGDNKVTLSASAVRLAIEDALNATRKDGEDRIRVLAVSTSYNYGPTEVTITTDLPTPEVQ